MDGIQIEKKEMNLFLFAENMIIYVEKSQEIYKKILKLISEFTKITKEYEAKTLTSIVFLYTSNE